MKNKTNNITEQEVDTLIAHDFIKAVDYSIDENEDGVLFHTYYKFKDNNDNLKHIVIEVTESNNKVIACGFLEEKYSKL